MTGKFIIHSWEESATGDWSPETGLYKLRDDSPNDLASLLWYSGKGVQVTGVIELLAHGNPRKAAEVARALVQQNPFYGEKIRSQYGSLRDYLFETPLENLPSKPEEYPLIDRIKFRINKLMS